MELICDFCTSPNITWEYPCKDFTDPLGMAMEGSWAACDECSKLIEAGDWDNLAVRSVNNTPTLVGSSRNEITVLVGAAKALFNGFRMFRTEERKPWG